MAAGTGGASGTYAGVAPQANLVGVIALDGGSGDEGDLLRAVDWTIENKDRFSIDVMCFSSFQAKMFDSLSKSIKSIENP